jgi:hypothetical protein
MFHIYRARVCVKLKTLYFTTCCGYNIPYKFGKIHITLEYRKRRCQKLHYVTQEISESRNEWRSTYFLARDTRKFKPVGLLDFVSLFERDQSEASTSPHTLSFVPISRSNYLRFLTGSGAHPASCLVGTGALSPGVKRPGREAHHSSPNAEVKNAWRYTSTPIRLRSMVLS